MKTPVRLMLIGIIAMLVVASINHMAQPLNEIKNEDENIDEVIEPLDIPINRQYIVAQLYGEVNITDICEFRQFPFFDLVTYVEIKGTVTNSTLLNPFAIWPPISFIPGLRMIILPNEAPVHLQIRLFKGKFYTKDDGAKVRFYGIGYLVNASVVLPT